MKKLTFGILVTLLVAVSCKKDKVEEPTPATTPVVVKTTAEKVLGKWGLTSLVLNEFYSNLNHVTTINGIASDYFDFKPNGKVYIKISLSPTIDSVAYNIVNDSTINFDGEPQKIKALNDTTFVMYNKESISTVPLEYDEQTINLKK